MEKRDMINLEFPNWTGDYAFVLKNVFFWFKSLMFGNQMSNMGDLHFFYVMIFVGGV
jgi:hypothetical protein